MSQLSREEALTIARNALPMFGIAGDAVIDFVKHRENVVFRVSEGPIDYALRIHRLGHRTDDEVATEGAFMTALGAEGFPVSEVVRTVAGALFASVPDSRGRTHHVDVQRWVAGGEPLGDAGAAWLGEDTLEAEVFARLGELCATFHLASRRIGKVSGYSRPAWDAEGLAGATALWGDPRRLATTDDERGVIDAAVRRIGQRLDQLGTAPEFYGVIHADFTPENVLTAGRQHVLIDFDDFGEGWWLFDLATILFWYHRHPRTVEYRQALLAGYRKHADIPERALEDLDTFILARGLTYLGWAADRPGDETSVFLQSEVLPVIVDLCREYIGAERQLPEGQHTPGEASLLARRAATIGSYSPLFYDRPLHFVSGDGVWLVDSEGNRYLDAYNNVPQVGHANPRVADAVCRQLNTLNVHTRYLSEPIVAYAEQLLGTFDAPLDRVYFTNSGSESNELAIRIARHMTGRSGVIVTDHSYHGNTIALAALTTGLTVSEPFGDHVRPIHVPDLDGEGEHADSGAMLERALAAIDEAIASLVESGHGVAALLIEPAFSTEGLPRVPEGYLEGVVERIQAAGGLVIADEVQTGLGRLGDVWWGHQATGIEPDLVTLGKPLGNGYPLGGVVTTAAILESFSSANMYFNTFAGTATAAAAGQAVLNEITGHGLIARCGDLGRHVARRLEDLVASHPRAASAKGRGLFFGLELVDDAGRPDSGLAKRIVEALVQEKILISRIGPNDNILKIRPPLVIGRDELERVIDALDVALGAETRAEAIRA
ncbi:aminotransferase class III-fold pyridoxal phosphate-dependent enzyme [Arthrobacter sp. NPDC089319]|uniref:aminotransferase class III-fold pyridoxal phosphate-dependent enzyme n=1 Tax=Arthrobacter sp. NPDC089319 TaxID=3155915 RepID=UPI003447CC87